MIHFHLIIVPLVVSAIKLFVIIIILWDESNFCISIHPRELYCFAIRPPVHSRQEDFGLHVECRLGYSCYIGDVRYILGQSCHLQKSCAWRVAKWKPFLQSFFFSFPHFPSSTTGCCCWGYFHGTRESGRLCLEIKCNLLLDTNGKEEKRLNL